ncbi:MAG: tetratricopeptide repeat protein [Limisphaerales bacterium]
MTTEREVSPEKKFVPALLPWLVAAGALAIYFVTLNPWVSLNSLQHVAKVSGWTWLPEWNGPFFWLVTYPFRWLPAHTIPLALNLFTAICAALTLALLARSVALLPQDRSLEQRLNLALLARSVALLPQDRSPDQRLKEHSAFSLLSVPAAWVPPVLAVLVCGLQLSFWENATVASADMFDLLVFAYAVRCLLEYRLSERESWLLRASLAFGLGMTNNWAMVSFFPAFLIALVWIKGLSFFNLRFLTRICMCCLAGLSLYFVLPLVACLGDTAAVPFWSALKYNLASQKHALQSVFGFCNHNRIEGLLLALPSLVPLIFIGIRWPSSFGDNSKLGIALTTFIFHLVHGLFLGVLIWIALNPPFTPHSRGYGPFLTYYYLGALSVGYCSGYFLLLFRGKPERGRRIRPTLRLLNQAITGSIWLLLLVAPAALVYRNLPQIRITNGPMLKNFAALLTQGLPARRVVLLSDDAIRLLLLHAHAAQTGKGKENLFLDTSALAWPGYHRFLKKQYPRDWESNPPKGLAKHAEPFLLVQLISRLAQTNDVYYLHPSFGYYFEFFYPESHGLVYKLIPYSTNLLFAPRPNQEVIAENEAFWAKADTQALQPLVAAITPLPPGKEPSEMESLMEKAHLPRESNHDAITLAGFYSRSLDYWGVEMQKSGQLTNAAAHFEGALELNPDNVVAQINLECNKNLQAGRKSSVPLSKPIEDEFAKYRKWEDILSENGPFDEPSYCYEQGRVFVGNKLYRQAAAQFDRVITLAPENLVARIWLSQLCVISGMPNQALKLLNQIRARPELVEAARTNRTELLFMEASAHLAQNDLRGAEAAVQATLGQYPGDEGLLATATQVYMKYGGYFDKLLAAKAGSDTDTCTYMRNGCYSNALTTIEQQLVISPADTNALVNKGFACIQIGAFEQAIPPLTKVLAMDTNNYSALFNRAIAFLRSDQLEAAQGDYEVLQKAFPAAFQIYFGLAEIAWRQKDTNAAIQYYQRYQANAPTNTTEAKLVRARLKELQPGSP